MQMPAKGTNFLESVIQVHLAVVVFSIYAAWRWGDWRNCRRYQASMLYLAAGNLLYNFLYRGHYLWKIKADILVSNTIGELVYTYVVFPATALIFLSNYPEKAGKQFLRTFKFIAVFFTVESLFLLSGRINYQNGWTLWWSLAWNCMMFPLIALHYKKPVLSYLVSIIVLVAMLIKFPVPLD